MSPEKENKDKRKWAGIFSDPINRVVFFLMLLFGIYVYINIDGLTGSFQQPAIVPETSENKTDSAVWTAPDTFSIPHDEKGDLIRYGRMLIANTSYYLGPNGIVSHRSNGMNCQNCHLDAGTKPFGNNYSAVASVYPVFRERSGTTENIYKRVNDCMERSLNGIALDTTGKEMQAIEAYIHWLGKDVKKGVKPKGSGISNLAYMDRSADPEKGKQVYVQKCQSCHMMHGEGKMNDAQTAYQYPPLWGKHSYNIGAGLHRLSRFAGYVKSNMPFGASYDQPQLSDEEAWDVAAYVNSQQRPAKDLSMDWPKIAAKPVDYPFAPYADNFNEQQHKYGPFGPIAEFKKQNK